MGFGILFVRKRLDLECPNHFEKCNHKDMMQILIKNSVHEAVLPQQGFILLITSAKAISELNRLTEAPMP